MHHIGHIDSHPKFQHRYQKFCVIGGVALTSICLAGKTAAYFGAFGESYLASWTVFDYFAKGTAYLLFGILCLSLGGKLCKYLAGFFVVAFMIAYGLGAFELVSLLDN
jgi:hypothetical protein